MTFIVVTGTPGTGKTTVATHLAERLGYVYVDVSEFIESHTLSEGYDDEKKCEIVDTDRLAEKLFEVFKGRDVVIDSHLSHYISKDVVDLCIVTKCDITVLKERLEKRGYSEKKVRENLDAEIFDTCRVEAEEAGHTVLVAETDKEVDYDFISKKVLS